MVALILSSILGFLPEAVRNHYLEVSKVATYLFNFRTCFVVIPPIMLVVLNMTGKKSSNSSSGGR
ncbi:MAG: hypothetical protein NTW50_01645 [Candidatus Berkelbacteria bacterium]|nr:hypothetical protein [Candidatus Berkelbacteria bacterium]